MKNKVFFVIILFGIVIGILVLINRDKSKIQEDKKQELLQIERNKERDKRVQDSLKKIQDSINRVNELKAAKKRELDVIAELQSYVNSSISNSNLLPDISVTITDINYEILSDVSSSIADIYNQNGINAHTGLFSKKFVTKPGYKELFEANEDIINKLNLSRYTDYLALGIIKNDIKDNEFTHGSFICQTSLSMTIISVKEGIILNSFTILANGNGASEIQAKNNSFDKLIEEYRVDNSLLKSN